MPALGRGRTTARRSRTATPAHRHRAHHKRAERTSEHNPAQPNQTVQNRPPSHTYRAGGTRITSEQRARSGRSAMRPAGRRAVRNACAMVRLKVFDVVCCGRCAKVYKRATFFRYGFTWGGP
eukprot:5197562-Prymnesium_polylepis.1